MEISRNEKRNSMRVSRSEEVMWRCSGHCKTEIGLLLESSEHGMAFAWRGSAKLKPGTLIEVIRGDLDDANQRKRAVVRRISPCHDNLSVIGIEIIDLRPFPSRYLTRATAPWERDEEGILATIRPEPGAGRRMGSSRIAWAG